MPPTSFLASFPDLTGVISALAIGSSAVLLVIIVLGIVEERWAASHRAASASVAGRAPRRPHVPLSAPSDAASGPRPHAA